MFHSLLGGLLTNRMLHFLSEASPWRAVSSRGRSFTWSGYRLVSRLPVAVVSHWFSQYDGVLCLPRGADSLSVWERTWGQALTDTRVRAHTPAVRETQRLLITERSFSKQQHTMFEIGHEGLAQQSRTLWVLWEGKIDLRCSGEDQEKHVYLNTTEQLVAARPQPCTASVLTPTTCPHGGQSTSLSILPFYKNTSKSRREKKSKTRMLFISIYLSLKNQYELGIFYFFFKMGTMIKNWPFSFFSTLSFRLNLRLCVCEFKYVYLGKSYCSPVKENEWKPEKYLL